MFATPERRQMLAVVLILVTTGTLQAAEIHVGTAQPYTDITSAIEAAGDGDIVTVHAGTYYEPELYLTQKNLLLRAEPSESRPRIVSTVDQWSNMIIIDADGITIRGFEITHQSGGQYGYGIGDGDGYYACSGWTVEENIIHDCRSAVWNNKRSTFTFRANEVYNNGGNGLYLEAAESFVCTSNFFHDATYTNNHAVILWYTGNAANAVGNTLIAFNYIHGGRTGILIAGQGARTPSGSRTLTIAHNTIDGLKGAWNHANDYAGQLLAFWDNSGQTYDATKITVRDNLFAESLWYAIYNGESGTKGLVGDLHVRNCLFFTNYSCNAWYPSYKYPQEWPGPRGQVGWTTRGGDFIFSYCLVADPLLARTGTTAGEYYALQAGSPALTNAADGSNIGAWQGHTVKIDWKGSGAITPANPKNLWHGQRIGCLIRASDEDHHIASIAVNGKIICSNSANCGVQSTNITIIVTSDTALSATFTPSTTASGIPIAWLTMEGVTNKTDEVENMDLDEDGFTVLQEYIANTHPKDSNSHLSPITVDPVPGGLLLAMGSTSTGRTYHVEMKTNLLQTTWTSVTNVPGTGDPWTFEYPTQQQGSVFFRNSVSVP